MRRVGYVITSTQPQIKNINSAHTSWGLCTRDTDKTRKSWKPCRIARDEQHRLRAQDRGTLILILCSPLIYTSTTPRAGHTAQIPCGCPWSARCQYWIWLWALSMVWRAVWVCARSMSISSLWALFFIIPLISVVNAMSGLIISAASVFVRQLIILR